MDEDDDVMIGMPSARINTFGATYEFKAPLPLPDFLTKKDSDEDEKVEQSQEQPSANNEPEEVEDPVEISFTAGINGGVVRQKQPYYVTYEDSDEMVQVQVSLLAKNVPYCFLLIQLLRWMVHVFWLPKTST